MSIQIIDDDKEVLTIKLSGKLNQGELTKFRELAKAKLSGQEKRGVLIIATEFKGWDNLQDMGDLTEQLALDHLIKKMAIVGDENRENIARIFTAKGMRKFPIEFFKTPDQTRAVAWVESD